MSKIWTLWADLLHIGKWFRPDNKKNKNYLDNTNEIIFFAILSLHIKTLVSFFSVQPFNQTII